MHHMNVFLLQKSQTSNILHLLQNQAPFVTFKDSSESELVKDQYEGYIMDLVEAVAEVASLDHTLHINALTYDMLVQDLVDNKTDIIVADLTIKEERLEKIDFSMPFMAAGLTIIMRKPSISDRAPFSFLKPFSLSIWLYILTAYVVVSCLMAAISRLEDVLYNVQNIIYRTGKEEPFSISYSFWFNLASLLGQGVERLPQ